MKNLLSALYDSMLLFLLLFIVVASFIATFALSPIPYRESLLAQNQTPILGEEDTAVLRFEDRYEEHDFFKVTSVHDERTYSATIQVGPMSEGELDKALLSIFNDTKVTRKAVVNIKVSESSAKDLNLKLRSGDFVVDANQEAILEITPEDSRDVSFQMTTSERINFPIETVVSVSLK